MDQSLWQPHQQGKELYRQTVVIVGLGDLGYTIAKRLKAFECYIIGVKRRKSKCPDVLDEIYTTESLDDVYHVQICGFSFTTILTNISFI